MKFRFMCRGADQDSYKQTASAGAGSSAPSLDSSSAKLSPHSCLGRQNMVILFAIVVGTCFVVGAITVGVLKPWSRNDGAQMTGGAKSPISPMASAPSSPLPSNTPQNVPASSAYPSSDAPQYVSAPSSHPPSNAPQHVFALLSHPPSDAPQNLSSGGQNSLPTLIAYLVGVCSRI